MKRIRRGRGEGSIFKRKDGDWCAYVTLPTLEPGKRRRRYVYGHDKAAVRLRLAQLQVKVASGEFVKQRADRTTVAVYLSSWLAGLEVRDRTAGSYRWITESYLIPRLGGARLEALETVDIEKMLHDLRAEGVGDRTRQLCYDTLRIPLRRAVRAKMLAYNPIEAVSRPRYERREMTPWTPEEARAVVEASRSDRFHALYVLELRLGLQFPGEVLGLRWSDVDLKKREIYLSTQLTGRTRQSGPTKTEARRRRLVLPQQVVDALLEHRERLMADGLRSSPWLFPNRDGGPMNARNFVRDSFEKVIERSGVRRVRPYDMRHTFATLALIAGVHPKIVSEILGHASIEQTLRTYSHLMPGMQEEAVRALDRLWNEPLDVRPRISMDDIPDVHRGGPKEAG